MTVKARIHRPTHQRQLVSSDKYGKYNCTAYAMAMFADAVTLGGCRVKGRQIRAWSDEPVPDPTSPGLNLSQIIVVANKLGIELDNRTGDTWAEAMDLLDGDRRIIAQVSYAELGKARCQGADFGHAILLQARRRRPGGIAGWEILANDPLCTAAKWYQDDLVREAMAKFGDETHVPGAGLRFATSRVVPQIAVVS